MWRIDVMALLVIFSVLVLVCFEAGWGTCSASSDDAEYPDCTRVRASVGDSVCNAQNNNEECGYDGGDCCECTCVDDSRHLCGFVGFSCLDLESCPEETFEYPLCTDRFSSSSSYTSSFGISEYSGGYSSSTYQSSSRTSSIDDGDSVYASFYSYYDASSSRTFTYDGITYGNLVHHYLGDGICDLPLNHEHCGYDGGDCCECTCSGWCSHFQCEDPDAGNIESLCQEQVQATVPCSPSVQPDWVVNSTEWATALAQASNCSGGSFTVEWKGNIVVKHVISVLDGTVFKVNGASSPRAVADGGGITQLFYVVGATLHVDNLEITNGTAVVGGAIGAIAGSLVTLHSTTLSNNTGTVYGGAIALNGSTVVLAGQTVLSGNRAGRNGGVIFAEGASNVTCSGTMLAVENTASVGYGGAYFVDTKSIVFHDGDAHFSLNRGQRGGALFVIGSSTATFGGGAHFTENRAAFENAGAIFVGESQAFFANHATFSGNSARKDGGALKLYHSTVTFMGKTEFSENSANASGGALFMNDNSSVTCEGETYFLNNNAASFGGGLFMRYGTFLNLSRYTKFVSNKAGLDGGALGSSLSDGDRDSSSLAIAGNASFIDNMCSGSGGGMALKGALSVTLETTAQLVFFGNSAGVAGGAVLIQNTGVGPKFTGVSFTSNSARLGGAVYATSSGTAESRSNDEISPTTFDTCTFVNNSAEATGGAMESGAGKDVIRRTSFVGNSAGVGGALRLAGTTSLEECSFVDNISDEGGGPAVSNIGLISELRDSSFEDNVFQCVPGTFLDFSASIDVHETVCSGCRDCEGSCNYSQDRGPLCTEVMAHSSSSGGQVTLATLSIEGGYWRATNSSTRVLPCYNPSACNGGETGSSRYCHDGYKGSYCSVCVDGYTKGIGSTCKACNDSGGDLAVAVVIASLALLAFVVFLSYMISGEVEERPGIIARVTKRIPLQSIKILIVAWQILTQFGSVANVTYPGIYQTFLNGVDILNFDLTCMISTSCLLDVDFDFHARLLVSTMSPFIGMAILGTSYLIAARRSRGSAVAVGVVRQKHLSIVLLLTFLVYSSVSSTIFQMFDCERLDDGISYLRADYQIDCDKSNHKKLQIYSWFMIAIYPIGIPLLYTVLLFRSRSVLMDTGRRKDDAWTKSTTALWKPYQPDRFYYEVIECGRRILLTGVVVFIYPNTMGQVAVTIVVTAFFTVLSEALAPYASPWDTWVSRAGHATIFLSMYIALLLKVDVSGEPPRSQGAFEAILVSVHVVLILTVLVEAVALTCSLRVEQEDIPQVNSICTLSFGLEAERGSTDDDDACQDVNGYDVGRRKSSC